MSTRDAYVEKFKAELDQWNADIDKLEAKARAAEADSKINYQKHLEELRARRDKAREKLEQVQSAGDEAWDDLKSGADEAWNAARDAVRSAMQRFQ